MRAMWRNQGALKLDRKARRTSVVNALRQAVRISDEQGVCICEWVASHAVDFFTDVSLLYDLCLEDAEARFVSPGEGFPPNYEYHWLEKGRLSSPQYVEYVLDWIDDRLNDTELFPVEDDAMFPEEFEAVVSKIFTRMFRIYAIIYHHHLPALQSQGAKMTFDMSLRHFMFFAFEHDLIKCKEFRAMSEMVDGLLEEYSSSNNSSDYYSIRYGFNEDEDEDDRQDGDGSSRSLRGSTSSSDEISEEKSNNNSNATTTIFAPRTDSYIDNTTSVRFKSNIVQRVFDSTLKMEGEIAKPFVDAVKQLLQSKLNFSELMNKLVDEYVIPARTRGRLTEYEVSKMFVNVFEMLRLSEFLTAELHSAIGALGSSSSPTGEIRLEEENEETSSSTACSVLGVMQAVDAAISPHLAFFRVFTNFVKEFDESLQRIKEEIKVNPRFASIVKLKNAKLNSSILDILEEVRSYPELFLNRLAHLLNVTRIYYTNVLHTSAPTVRDLVLAVMNKDFQLHDDRKIIAKCCKRVVSKLMKDAKYHVKQIDADIVQQREEEKLVEELENGEERLRSVASGHVALRKSLHKQWQPWQGFHAFVFLDNSIVLAEQAQPHQRSFPIMRPFHAAHKKSFRVREVLRGVKISQDHAQKTNFEPQTGTITLEFTCLDGVVTQAKLTSLDLLCAIFQVTKTALPKSICDAFSTLTTSLDGERARNQTRMEQANFFISHHPHESGTEAMLLYFDLKDRGYGVWMEKSNEYRTTDCRRSIIEQLDVFVLVLSSGTLLRPWVQFEVRTAKELGIPIVVVYHRIDDLEQEKRLIPDEFHFLFHQCTEKKPNSSLYVSTVPFFRFEPKFELRVNMWEQIFKMFQMDPLVKKHRATMIKSPASMSPSHALMYARRQHGLLIPKTLKRIKKTTNYVVSTMMVHSSSSSSLISL